jgi:hypothetical protein
VTDAAAVDDVFETGGLHVDGCYPTYDLSEWDDYAVEGAVRSTVTGFREAADGDVDISDAVRHVAGMKGADAIIVINDDPNAPIFDVADDGIADDPFEVVPALTEEFS